jgi:hypothetical protein
MPVATPFEQPRFPWDDSSSLKSEEWRPAVLVYSGVVTAHLTSDDLAGESHTSFVV